jgi:hypothetical protein
VKKEVGGTCLSASCCSAQTQLSSGLPTHFLASFIFYDTNTHLSANNSMHIALNVWERALPEI